MSHTTFSNHYVPWTIELLIAILVLESYSSTTSMFLVDSLDVSCMTTSPPNFMYVLIILAHANTHIKIHNNIQLKLFTQTSKFKTTLDHLKYNHTNKYNTKITQKNQEKSNDNNKKIKNSKLIEIILIPFVYRNYNTYLYRTTANE